tara:strand:- start:1880 stop:3241 length:1362 start_codon:yes stop_codon:yes gene_type:complete
MTNTQIENNNSITISKELDWLVELIDIRFENYFELNHSDKSMPNAPNIESDNSFYSRWIISNKLKDFDRLVIICCIANIFFPEIFDKFLIKNKTLDKRFTEFSGKMDEDKSRFIPTVGTINFIYYGRNTDTFFNTQFIFDRGYILNKISAIYFSNEVDNNYKMSKIIYLEDEIIKLITLGQDYKPDFSSNFPAKLLSTDLNWSDLVLNDFIRDEIENISTWIKYKYEITNDINISQKLNFGYKCLFYGPPGTGKTLTAALLGKHNNVDVYRVDLSQIVSKYVGETEKNLSRIFDIAENKNWILFFDEAESLFSKRTAVSSSQDKFANQLTGYLLQRIEDFKGLVVLATNLKPNIDRAFSRRIQTIVNFTLPSFNERKILWKNSIKNIASISNEEINSIAKDHEISGGSIKNIIQYSWLVAKRNGEKISLKHIVKGVKREVIKDGKTFEISKSK